MDIRKVPETGFMRLPEVLALIPVSRSLWWKGVRNGRFPKAVKLSARCTAWRNEDILILIKLLGEQGKIMN
jgi:predicted DNA-binding transcriptional regulator AlpA